jgi:hypothetical protein
VCSARRRFGKPPKRYLNNIAVCSHNGLGIRWHGMFASRQRRAEQNIQNGFAGKSGSLFNHARIPHKNVQKRPCPPVSNPLASCAISLANIESLETLSTAGARRMWHLSRSDSCLIGVPCYLAYFGPNESYCHPGAGHGSRQSFGLCRASSFGNKPWNASFPNSSLPLSGLR